MRKSNAAWYVGYCVHGIMIMASEDRPSSDFMVGVAKTGFAPLTNIRVQLNRCNRCSNEVQK